MWFFLTLMVVFHFVMCYLIFNKDIHAKWWYLFLGVLLAALNNFVWFYSAKIIENKKEMYLFSALYSILITVVYFLVPILFFGLKINKWELIGIVLMIIGFIIFRTNQN